MGMAPPEDSNPCGGGESPPVAEERFMIRRFLAATAFLAVALFASAQTDSIANKLDKDKVKVTGSTDSDFKPDQLAAQQARMKQDFLEFKHAILRLAQNL